MELLPLDAARYRPQSAFQPARVARSASRMQQFHFWVSGDEPRVNVGTRAAMVRGSNPAVAIANQR
jgi:hypothetical protein